MNYAADPRERHLPPAAAARIAETREPKYPANAACVRTRLEAATRWIVDRSASAILSGAVRRRETIGASPTIGDRLRATPADRTASVRDDTTVLNRSHRLKLRASPPQASRPPAPPAAPAAPLLPHQLRTTISYIIHCCPLLRGLPSYQRDANPDDAHPRIHRPLFTDLR